MHRSVLLFLSVLAAACTREPADRYGFVATLGRDTVSVERIARSDDRLVTDGVDRFPYVRRRHTEYDLHPDGTIRRMVMDVRTPSGKTAAERGRRVTADFSDDVVRISIRDSSGVRDTSWLIRGEHIVVPHVSMMYSAIELEIAAALRWRAAAGDGAPDTVGFRQFYPDRDIGAGNFTLHRGTVRALGGGRIELVHDWLAGTGDATVDSGGRLLDYSGARTTYKVLVRRTTELPDVEAIAGRFAAAEHRSGASRLSVRDTTRATIGNAALTVAYGRPLARGRQLLGEVIPHGYFWRTGANEATELVTSAPITLAGVSLASGKYTLWTVPYADGRVELVVNSQTGQWGTQHDRARDIGSGYMSTATAPDTVERFTIAVQPTDAKRGMLDMSWGTFRWTAPIVVR